MPTSAERAARFLRRFRRRKEGTTAIEFSLLAIPFLTIMFGLIETGIVFMATGALDAAVQDTARLIRTGQSQAQGLDAAAFRQRLCDEIDMWLNCDGRLQIDVRRFQDFNTVTFANPLQPNGAFDTGNMTFAPGQPGDVVLVRVFYAWTIQTPLIGGLIANMPNDQRLLSSAAVFRNEPFGSIVGS